MDYCILLLLGFAVMVTSAWSVPFYPVPTAPLRITRFAPHPPPHHPGPHHPAPQHRTPAQPEESQWQRPKRDHDDYDHDHDHGHGHDHGRGHNRGSSGVTGPVHTFVKTDKNANYKWGVRHHVGNKYA